VGKKEVRYVDSKASFYIHFCTGHFTYHHTISPNMKTIRNTHPCAWPSSNPSRTPSLPSITSQRRGRRSGSPTRNCAAGNGWRISPPPTMTIVATTTTTTTITRRCAIKGRRRKVKKKSNKEEGGRNKTLVSMRDAPDGRFGEERVSHMG